MIKMKKIKSYTSIWNVEKVIYTINDLQLTFTQMTWFFLSLFIVMMLSNLPPLSLIEGGFFKYLGIPVFITGFISQKTFDGKKPYGFLKSLFLFIIAPKLTFAGKPIKLTKKVNGSITTVKSEL